MGGNPVLIKLKSGNQVPDPPAKRLGDFDQIIHGWGFDSAFNPADENRGEVCPFSQFFLAESCLFPFGSDCLAQQAAVFFNGRHDQPKEQEDGKLRHVGNDQFCGFRLHFFGKRFKRMAVNKGLFYCRGRVSNPGQAWGLTGWMWT